MQLGMVGLGRMGANMVRRLMAGGHRCVVFDLDAKAVERMAADGAKGAVSLDSLVEALDPPRLAVLAWLDDAAFRAAFSKSPIKRTGRDRFVRNVLIAIGNSGEASLWGSARVCLDDPSPLVRAMAVWALSRLLDADAFARLRAERLEGEVDPDVRGEWQSPP